MGLFGRRGEDKEKKKAKNGPEEEPKKEEAKQEEAQQPQQPKKPAPPRAVLNSQRMAGVYGRLYRWVLSVSLNFDSYQIESGEGRLPDGAIPLRGYYSRLIAKLAEYVPEEQRGEFEQTLSVQALAAAFSEGRSCVNGLFYARLDAEAREGEAETEAEINDEYGWYEFRAERIPDPDPARQQFLLYIRRTAGERDDGRLPDANVEYAKTEDGGYDWSSIRAERLINNDKYIYFEYQVSEDRLHIHRRRGDKTMERVEEHYLATLDLKGNWMVANANTKDVWRLFRSAIDGMPGEAEILFRKDAMQGANFIHYRIVCRPLEQRGKPTWLFGSLQDVEERVRQREQNRDVMMQMDHLLKNFYSSMYQIDLSRKRIYRILFTDSGFHKEKEGTPLDVYLQRQVNSGVIAPDSVKQYMSWLQPGYLQHKTENGSYEFEASLRLSGTTEYRWYSETLSSVEDRPNLFMRLRRDVTETHQLRQSQFAMEENSHMAEYSRSVLDTIANLVEFRNLGNSEHIAHVRELTRMLLTDVAARSPKYRLTPRIIDLYAQAATMHDIGKITIPDSILNKAGRYTPEEFEVMKTHTTSGAHIVDRLEMRGLGEMKAVCRDVVLHHHERFDGGGYPDRLAGDEISIGVQAVSLADVYDALVSVRCYKDALGYDEAREMILTGKCGVFNPLILESMQAIEPKMRALYGIGGNLTKAESASAEALMGEAMSETGPAQTGAPASAPDENAAAENEAEQGQEEPADV